MFPLENEPSHDYITIIHLTWSTILYTYLYLNRTTWLNHSEKCLGFNLVHSVLLIVYWWSLMLKMSECMSAVVLDSYNAREKPSSMETWCGGRWVGGEDRKDARSWEVEHWTLTDLPDTPMANSRLSISNQPDPPSNPFSTFIEPLKHPSFISGTRPPPVHQCSPKALPYLKSSTSLNP